MTAHKTPDRKLDLPDPKELLLLLLLMISGLKD